MAQSQQSNLVGTLLELAAVVGVTYAVYAWLKTQCADPASLLQGTSPCSMFDNIFGLTAPVASVSPATGSSLAPAQTVASQPAPALTPAQQQGAFTQALASSNPPSLSSPPVITGPGGTDALSLILQTLAGGSGVVLNVDGWNYYLNTLPGFLNDSSAFSAAFPNLTATDRGPNMTASQFIQAMVAGGLVAPSGYGLTGLPGGGIGLPRYMIHHPGRGRWG